MHLLLLSNAKREGAGYLEWAQPLLADFMAASAVRSVLFVPFAGVTSTPDDYTEKVRLAFEPLGIGVEGIHRAADPAAAVRQAQAVLVGGGSTWKLLREVRALRLLRAIRQRVLAGLRECTGLRLAGQHLSRVGDGGDCRIFRHATEPFELAPGSDVQFLMAD